MLLLTISSAYNRALLAQQFSSIVFNLLYPTLVPDALPPPVPSPLTSVVVAERRAGAVARPAVGEAEVARLAAVALAADHVRLARALAAERVALEALRALAVTLALERAVVVVGGEREHGVTAESWR